MTDEAVSPETEKDEGDSKVAATRSSVNNVESEKTNAKSGDAAGAGDGHVDEVEEDLFFKNTESFRCFTQVEISRSSLYRNILYKFPQPVDPGIDDAFNYEEPVPPREDTGVRKYKAMCKDFNIVPLSRIINDLGKEVLDLKYYGLSTNQIRALCSALSVNLYVRKLILQDNWLTPEAVPYISEMLAENTTIRKLNIKECRLGPEGAEKFNAGLMNLGTVLDINMSFNGLGNEGIQNMKQGLIEDFITTKWDLSHNQLDSDVAPIFEEIFTQNRTIEELNLSWNNINSPAAWKILSPTFLSLTYLRYLDLSWNFLNTRLAIRGVARLIEDAQNLEYVDISNNYLSGGTMRMLRKAILNSISLVTIKLGNNPVAPEDAWFLAKAVTMNPFSTLTYMDLENVFVNKDFIPILKAAEAMQKRIRIGGIYGNWEIKGPDIKTLLFQRAIFLALKPKKKKRKRNFGHFVLGLPDEAMATEEFFQAIAKNKIKLDADLITLLAKQFSIKKVKVDGAGMKSAFMERYPDTVLPPKVAKKGKKGKKGGKKGAREPETETPIEKPPEEVPQEDIPPTESEQQQPQESGEPQQKQPPEGSEEPQPEQQQPEESGEPQPEQQQPEELGEPQPEQKPDEPLESTEEQTVAESTDPEATTDEG